MPGNLDPYSERLEALLAERAELEARLAGGDLARDRNAFRQVTRRYKQLTGITDRVDALRAAIDDRDAAAELLGEATPAEAESLQADAADAEARIAALEAELTDLLAPRDPNDGKDVIVEIRGAEGGEEANLFARELFEMYLAYAERQGWKVDVLGSQASDLGGITNVAFEVSGDDVWRRLRFEGGPHRVQRVPETESQGRIHTSSATVSVLAEADEVEVQIDEADLQISVFRSSGPGGQSVNTTDSAVRVTHKPTGLVVSMQDEKSQLQNRNKALQVLRARLLRLEQERAAAEASDQRRSQIGRGGRSEKIRTYNYKENRVTDHRIGLTLYKLDRVLAGDLDEIIEALARHDREQALAAAAP
ncbi:MAG: peptide chain release factor 1 [bacterium]|nr:peptide chain release factor 1 [bacterium]MXV89062.1 peptide chain release factor 1 [Acidimicrobiia bacterium]MYC44215.1 peptide chain release factor 1 [Acidimicrobiia bacterium]MYI19526.1 peptide chain release factor 1 [Acidimicrobiia bacterium]